jgi:hypothetical protein
LPSLQQGVDLVDAHGTDVACCKHRTIGLAASHFHGGAAVCQLHAALRPVWFAGQKNCHAI